MYSSNSSLGTNAELGTGHVVGAYDVSICCRLYVELAEYGFLAHATMSENETSNLHVIPNQHFPSHPMDWIQFLYHVVACAFAFNVSTPPCDHCPWSYMYIH